MRVEVVLPGQLVGRLHSRQRELKPSSLRYLGD